MLDTPISPSRVLSELRQAWAEKPPSLAAIFQAGERLAGLADVAGVQADLPAQRIAVLGAATIDYLSRAIACAVVQEGVFPVIYQAPFGAYVQEALNPASALHGFAPELAVIAPEARDLVEALPLESSAAEVTGAIEAKVAMFGRVWDALAARGCRVVQHLLVPPVEQYRGMAERLAPASPFNQVRSLNDALVAAGRGRVQWVDLERLAAAVGARRFSANRFWHSARLGFDQRFLPDYLPAFRGAWRSACGRGKKVLTLDLDNTLWGGVIGDDGAEGLSLGPGSPEGEAFADWQRCAVLRVADFAAFDCSWNDKVAGWRRISEALNLGLDSIVFADDNPAECALIRRALPEVAVVELGPEPAEFPALLDAGHWFDMADFTAEDFSRTEAYAARAEARAARAQVSETDLDGYLASLAMTGRLYRPTEADIPRLAQLEQKTNQFNLTTRRYSETEIRAFLARDDAVVLAFRLADRFGDHGLTSSLIAVQERESLRIDSWLMSCRIFSRTAEPFILRGLLEIARQRGVRRLVGEYVPTAKNGVVADLYARMGFAAGKHGSAWYRDVDASALAGADTHIVARSS
ncbi:MAG: FkbH domain-containing protein [Alphaproteobacteria bacterium]|nr:FkbH domain-containing protein [Alphaproteobacteria bacterium]